MTLAPITAVRLSDGTTMTVRGPRHEILAALATTERFALLPELQRETSIEQGKIADERWTFLGLTAVAPAHVITVRELS